MINLELIRLNLSSLIFDNLINSIDNFSKMEEIYEELKKNYSENCAQLIFLDIFSNILLNSNNNEYLNVLDSIYTYIFNEKIIIPIDLLKEDIINQNDYTYDSDKKITFYQKALNEVTSDEVYLHYNNLLLKELTLFGKFLQNEYITLYSSTRDKNKELNNKLIDYQKIKYALAYFN